MPLRQTITQFVSEISSQLGLPFHQIIYHLRCVLDSAETARLYDRLTESTRSFMTALPERSSNPSPTNPPALDAGYRWVEVGETIEADDEYSYDNGQWERTNINGRVVEDAWSGRIWYRRRVAPDPGQGYRLLNSDEIVESSDGFWHGRWGVVFAFGSPAGNGCWYRRRVVPDPARMIPTISCGAGFRLLRPDETLATDDEYYLDTERRWVQTQLPLSTADDSIIYRRAVQSVGAGFTRLFWGAELQEGDEFYNGNEWVRLSAWTVISNPRIDDDQLYRRPVQVDDGLDAIRYVPVFPNPPNVYYYSPRWQPLDGIGGYIAEDLSSMELDNGPNNWPAIRSPLIPLCWDTRQGVIFGPQSQLLYQILLSSLDIRRSNPGRGVYYLRNPKQLSTQSMRDLEQWLRVNAYCYMGNTPITAPVRWARNHNDTFLLNTNDQRQYHNFAYDERSDTLLVFAHPYVPVSNGPLLSLVRSDLLCKIVAIGDAYFHHSFIMEMPRSDFNPSECNFLLNSLLARGSAMKAERQRAAQSLEQQINDTTRIAINIWGQNSSPPPSSPPSSSSGAGGLIRKVKR